MRRSCRLVLAAAALAAAPGCSAATASAVPERAGAPPADGRPRTPAEQARADGGRMAYTAADVRFMQGMIAHHAQAVVMARWAPTHGASAAVRTLAGRIEVAQQDESAFMAHWLRQRGEPVAAPHAGHDTTAHEPPAHDMASHAVPASGALMPGMLTAAQLAQLDAARGVEFDRLFLAFMIQHHEGALTMVRQLFSSPGAGQDVLVFRFASDVEADQTTEIDRMRLMLAALPADGTRP